MGCPAVSSTPKRVLWTPKATVTKEEYCENLVKALDEIHQEIRDKGELKRWQKAAHTANANQSVQFEIGDLVMVTAWKNAAHVKRGSKLCPLWQGPCEVVNPLSTTAYEVRLLGRPNNKKVKALHWSRMKRFVDKTFPVTEREADTNGTNDCQNFDVDSFQGWRVDDDGDVQLKVRWHGFQPQDDTWEDLEQLHGDVPVIVTNCLQLHVDEDDRLN